MEMTRISRGRPWLVLRSWIHGNLARVLHQLGTGLPSVLLPDEVDCQNAPVAPEAAVPDPRGSSRVGSGFSGEFPGGASARL
jgi:hypothetical protein